MKGKCLFWCSVDLNYDAICDVAYGILISEVFVECLLLYFAKPCYIHPLFLSHNYFSSL